MRSRRPLHRNIATFVTKALSPGDSFPKARALASEGRAVDAFAVFKRLLRTGDAPGPAAEGLFSILMRSRRYAAAARLAPMVAALTPATGARLRDYAELAIAQREAGRALAIVETAGAADDPVGGLERLKFVAERLRDELAAPDDMAGRRHIAIGGAAYCGSTILGIILGSARGFAFAGETHWLTQRRTESGEREPLLGSDVPFEKWPIACRACGRHCDCFDVPFRLALAADNTGWYAKIADRLGVQNLVTSDKNYPIIEEHDPLFRFDYLLSYKSPVSYLRSQLKQNFRKVSLNKPVTADWAQDLLERWAVNYREHLKIIRPTGRRVVMDWDKFIDKPHFHLKRLAEILDLPLRPNVVKRVSFSHFIGGNVGVDVAALRLTRTLQLRPSDAPDLPPAIRDVALNFQSSNPVPGMLDAEYRSAFSREA